MILETKGNIFYEMSVEVFIDTLSGFSAFNNVSCLKSFNVFNVTHIQRVHFAVLYCLNRIKSLVGSQLFDAARVTRVNIRETEGGAARVVPPPAFYHWTNERLVSTTANIIRSAHRPSRQRKALSSIPLFAYLYSVLMGL